MLRPGIRIHDKKILVVPPSHPSEEVHEILGGRAYKEDKKWAGWLLQPTAWNVLCLGEWYGAEFISGAPEEVQDLFRLDWGFPGFEKHKDLEARAISHPRFKDLYPFQRTAVEYLVCNPHRGAILALSPGLGKTPVAIVAWDVLQLNKVLILAPLTLAKNWGKEIEKWSRYFRSWTRATAANKDPISEVTITNFETVFYTVCRDEDGKVYEPNEELWIDDPNDSSQEICLGLASNPRAVKKWIEEGPKKRHPRNNKRVPVRERITQARPSYANVDWDLLIVDESILFKNRKAIKVDVVLQLAKYSHNVWLLSGSPTAKFKDDLYPQCKLIMPRGFSAYWRFAEFFCVVDKGEWGWSIVGDRPNVDPKKYLKDILFVRNQKDVLPDLPDYIYEPIEIDLTGEQQKAFNQMLDEWLVQLEEAADEPDVEAVNRLAQTTRMLQITSNLCNLTKAAGKPMPSSSAKENLLADMVRNGDIEFPLLVWCWWVPTCESVDLRFEKEFKDLRSVYVTGQMTTDQKEKGIEGYKDGEYDALVLQMGVGKFGHTLTNTKTVYYHDRSFDSDGYLQSLRRVKRIGLTHRPRLIVPRAARSADPLVEANLAGKMQSISKVSNHDLRELLQSIGGIPWEMMSYNTGFEDL